MKTTLVVISALFAGVVASNAAGVIVSNLGVGGPGDTLYAMNNNTLMNGGVVTMGYFPSTVTTADIDTIPELLANLSTFVLLTSAAPGSLSALGTADPGYAIQELYTDMGTITGAANPLIGRMMYSIVTSAATLNAATLSSEFALLAVGTIKDDVPVPQSYSSDPGPLTPIIGSKGTIVGDFAGLGQGTYNTLKMDVIPETSTALLGALGALGLLRRRR